MTTPATPERQAENEVYLRKVLEMFPELTGDTVGDLLMEATPFPFASIKFCFEQLDREKHIHKGSAKAAIDHAHTEVSRLNAEYQKGLDQTGTNIK